jgi:hypothetical protein
VPNPNGFTYFPLLASHMGPTGRHCAEIRFDEGNTSCAQEAHVSLNGVSFLINKLSHMIFYDMTLFMKKERREILSR